MFQENFVKFESMSMPRFARPLPEVRIALE
jgi:hypothetical protein